MPIFSRHAMRDKSVIMRLMACCALVLFLCCSTSLYAAPVNEEMAVAAAKNRVATDAVFRQTAAENGTSFRILSISRLELNEEGMAPAWLITLYPRGYMIIAGDDRMSPVIAYSADNDIDLSPVPSNAFRALVEADMHNIGVMLRETGSGGQGLSRRMQHESKRFDAHIKQWQKILEGAVSGKGAASRSVQYADTEPEAGTGPEPLSDSDPVTGPLLGDLLWNQNNHYNELCPDDPDASAYYDGHMPTGCVATAAGQIMKYHSWPPYGTGSHSYTWNDLELAADFTDSLDWALMKNSYNPWGVEPPDSEMAVSELLYELGVSVEMNYTHSGSSASINAVNNAMNHYFFYEPGVANSEQDVFPALMQQEIEAGRPVLAGLTGHAVVIDGINQSASPVVFHVNYGWGGKNNGWYNLDAFPEGGPLRTIITGMEPVFMPLIDIAALPDTEGATFSLSWDFPWFRSAGLNGFQLMEAGYAGSDFFDQAESLSKWYASAGWQITSDGYDGQGFYFPPDLMVTSTLSFIDPFVPQTGAMLNFQCKAVIIDAVLYVEVSEDAGKTWQPVLTVNGDNASGGWDDNSISLGEFAGTPLLMRFRVDASANPFSYYPRSSGGGIWLDNIEITGAEIPEWHVLQTDIPADADSFELADRQTGTYLYRLLACSTQGCGNPSPAITVHVDASLLYGDFDRDGDVDGADLARIAMGEREMPVKEMALIFGTVAN